jgi:hypothetical protein
VEDTNGNMKMLLLRELHVGIELLPMAAMETTSQKISLTLRTMELEMRIGCTISFNQLPQWSYLFFHREDTAMQAPCAWTTQVS